MASDDSIKLLIDMGVSKENVQAVVKELERLRLGANDVAKTYEVLAQAGHGYVVSARQVETAEDALVRKAVELAAAQRAVNQVLEESATASAHAGTAAAAAGSKLAGAGQSMLQTGRVIQDFTQGGIGGILNNVEGLSMALGGGPGLAGVLTALGVAAFVLGPQIKSLWASMTEGAREKVPHATEEMAKFTESIKANKDELEELRKKESLTILEGERYRELVRDTTRLEEEQANARAARSVGANDNKSDRARAAAFGEAAGEAGGTAKVVDELVAAGVERPRAESWVADALKGNAGDIANVRLSSPSLKGMYVSPEEQEAWDAEQAGIAESGKAIGDARKAREARQARAKARAQSEYDRTTTEGVSRLEQDSAIDDRAARDAAASAKKAPKEANAATADRLLSQGPAIVGQAYGPEAAGAAANATAAEVQAMRNETISNLKSGQMPQEAVLNAFREVYEASARAARDNAQFSGRLRAQSQTAMDTFQ